MIRKFLREYYLLPPGEQRALLLLSLLVILTLGFRVLLGSLPPGEPAGLDQFQQEAREILLRLEEADSLKWIAWQSGRAGGWQYERAGSQSEPGAAPHLLDLNKADSASLLKLPGIGPVFAGRIVKYRTLLGGYYCTDQLSEVYGMSPETLALIAPMLVLKGDSVEKLRVNTCSFRELLRHPYLEYAHVKSLVQYIDRQGAINSEEDIILNCLLPDSILERIAPYMDFTK